MATDCVVFGFDGTKLNVLLIERGIEPYKGKWAFPGGFLNMDEDAEAGALRELREETGLTGAYIKQFHAFSSPGRDPRERVISIAYYALVRIQEVKSGDDAAKARWFALDEVPQLAFDHGQFLRKAQQELRRQTYFEPIGFELLPEKFTMKSLQQLYEAILGVKFDRRNFHDKMLHLGLLVQTGEKINEPPKEEAFLYTFNPSMYEEMKRKGFRPEF